LAVSSEKNEAAAWVRLAEFMITHMEAHHRCCASRKQYVELDAEIRNTKSRI